MPSLSNRRLHLVLALGLTAFAIARSVADAAHVATFSPRSLRACLALAFVLATLVVARVSRKATGLAQAAVAWCAVAGGVVACATLHFMYAARPDADFSLAGFEGGPLEATVFGALVGGFVGGVIAAFAAVARRLNKVAPELACVAGWSLAAAASVPARSYAAIAVSALGVAIQLARLRRERATVAPAQPYR